MKIHDLIQGSPEWLAYRAQHFNASDAPAMLGCSAYKTRVELLREIHTGIAAEVDIGTQKRFDNGHRLEALARPLAEELIGAELYPVTASLGRLSASFDGLTMDETTAFEHKALNAGLRASMPSHDGSFDIPLMHRVQMEQQLLVSGAGRVLFMASNFDAEGTLVEERHVWYMPDMALRQEIVDGWAQFERDLATYALPTSAPAAPAGKAPETLPALRIEVTGMVTASNLAEFKETALAAIRSVNRSLSTDTDFADAEKAVKWCGDVESRLAAAKDHALSQTASIDALFKAIDDISAEARVVRLDLDKLVTRRKVEVKEEAITKARKALDLHIAAINAEIAPMRMQAPYCTADFAGAIKGRRSLDSVHDALDTTLAGAKIAADNAGRSIRANLFAFKAKADGFEFLFSDLSQMVHKPESDFCLLVDARITTHKAAEAERARKAAEAEAARVAAAEQRTREQEAAHIAAQQAAAALAQAATKEYPEGQTTQQVLKAEPATADATDRAASADASPRGGAMGSGQAAAAAPAGDEPATLNLGVISKRLGFTISAQFLANVLRINPAKVDARSMLYTERQFRQICSELASHVNAMAVLYGKEEAAA